MINKLFLRKDIKIDTNDLAKICVQTGKFLGSYEAIDDIDILETMYLRELFGLEEIFIEMGMHFQWIEDKDTQIGILAIANEEIREEDIMFAPFKEYTPDIKTHNLESVSLK